MPVSEQQQADLMPVSARRITSGSGLKRRRLRDPPDEASSCPSRPVRQWRCSRKPSPLAGV